MRAGGGTGFLAAGPSEVGAEQEMARVGIILKGPLTPPQYLKKQTEEGLFYLPNNIPTT